MKKLSIAVPTLVAIVGIAIVSRMTVAPQAEGYEVVSAPTPYSLDHARVMSRAGEPEEQPSTF